MSKIVTFGVSIFAALLANNIMASEVQQPVIGSAVITKPTHNLTANVERKDIYLMPVTLTDKQRQSIFDYKPTPLEAVMDPSLPAKFDNGMNGVPVLDQGKHGSCVTFAVTGAIDALLSKGDYVSQLCNLELGSYLAARGYYPSGWEGANALMILNQIQEYGFINTENQRNKSCGSDVEYPKENAANTGTPVSLDDFKLKSEPLNTETSIFYTEAMLTPFQRFQWTSEKLEGQKMVINVKKFLVEQDPKVKTRLIFGVDLPVTHCSVGACAHNHAANDTWALTNAIKADTHAKLGGHEMIITGYDDTAQATDDEGVTHKGLFIIRNSWGDDVGDKGTYYMTYDFFKQFVTDIQTLYYVPDSSNS